MIDFKEVERSFGGKNPHGSFSSSDSRNPINHINGESQKTRSHLSTVCQNTELSYILAYNKTPSSLHKLTHFLPEPSFSHHSIYKSTRDKNEIDSGARGRSHKKHIHTQHTIFTHTPSRSQPHTAWECLVRCASVWVPL